MSEPSTNESIPAEESTNPSVETESSSSGSGSRPLSGIVPKLAIVVAVVASLMAGALWWQYRQFYVELAGDDERLLATLEDTRAYLVQLEDELVRMRARVDASVAAADTVRGDFEALPAELRALSRRVEGLAGGQIDARDSWLREQAEYYLVLANNELALGGRIGSAIEALELADDVLRDLGDPSMADVRGAIAAELQSLRSIDQPDLEGIVLELGGLAVRASELPMRAASPENFGQAEEELDEVEPGFGRLWARTKGALTSIVRVERQEEPVGQLLTESERRIVRRELELELQVARTAALDQRQADFRSSLVAADAILNRDYNRSAQSVIEARRLLGSLMQIELEPALPDIGDSLALIRSAPGAE